MKRREIRRNAIETLLEQGWIDEAIAAALKLSPRTVRWYRARWEKRLKKQVATNRQFEEMVASCNV